MGAVSPVDLLGNVLTFPRNDHVFAVSDEVRRSIRYPRPLRLDACHRWRRCTTASIRHRSSVGAPQRCAGGARDPARRTCRRHGRELQAAQGSGPSDPRGGVVRKRIPAVRFVFVGRDRSRTRCVPRRRPRSRRDRRLHRVPGRRAAGVRAFDVFALPSQHEGLPIALIEAMALGSRSVVTRRRRSARGDRARGARAPRAASAARGLADAHRPAARGSSAARTDGEAGRSRGADFDIRHSVRADREGLRGAPRMSAPTGVDDPPVQHADEARVIELLTARSGGPRGDRSAEFFRWKHCENPFGRSFMLLAEAERTDRRAAGLHALASSRPRRARPSRFVPSTRPRTPTTRGGGSSRGSRGTRSTPSGGKPTSSSTRRTRRACPGT